MSETDLGLPGGGLAVGSMLDFTDNLPTQMVLNDQTWLQSGHIEDDPLNFDPTFWDYTRGTLWSKTLGVSSRSSMVSAANGNTIVLAVGATTTPTAGGVMVSTDNGATFGAVVTLPNYTNSESASAIRWVQQLGLWVVASSLGKIHTSPDAVTWTERSSPTTNGINQIDFANGVLVLVGASGTIITSANGINYTLRSSGVTGISLVSVGFYNGVWLATGTTAPSGGSRSTDNGVTWSAVTLTSAAFNNVVRVVVSNIGFVITASSGSGGIFTSTTGATGSWVYVGHRSLSLDSPTFNGEFYMFVSSGQIYKSYDLIEMRRYNFGPTSLRNVNIRDGRFLCVSVDGVNDSALWIGNVVPYAGNPTREGSNVIGVSRVAYVRIK